MDQIRKLNLSIMNRRLILFINILLISSGILRAQNLNVNPKLLRATWPAYWISMKNNPQKEYGVYHFRKNFNINNIPPSFHIHVSGDNRYRLYVNGIQICSGPARGDLFNWFYDTVDIAPLLVKGRNTIAAIVWNMGQLAPVAQVSIKQRS
jgi:alpha-L-rhamnosidase